MIERTTPEVTPKFKQSSDTRRTLNFDPDHLMEPTTDCANTDTDNDARETYYRALTPGLFSTIE